MWKRAPLLSLMLAVCLVSLTGVPPTAGFFGKIFIFQAGIEADLAWLVIIAVLNTIISAYYYLGVVLVMFRGEAEEGDRVRLSPSIGLSAGIATLGCSSSDRSRAFLQAAQDAADVLRDSEPSPRPLSRLRGRGERVRDVRRFG
jgi:NADH:ubiquinone oxidoreductase subunit 5 (subunit L)/multisubunit Na+/H+ antiporter MnhA subunit